MKIYLKERRRPILIGFGCLIFINIYFGILCKAKVNLNDLIYLDFVLLVVGVLVLVMDFQKWNRLSILYKRGCLGEDHKMAEELLGPQVYQIMRQEQELRRTERQQFQGEISELTDYIAKWAHEIKLPLSSLRLMNERNPDVALQSDMQGRLEYMQQLLNTMLMCSKLKTLENDCKYEKVKLREVVQESLRNQSYFLIREHFEIKIALEEATVYTDKRWFVYILDQLIGNAVKYRRELPELRFDVKQISEEKVLFSVEDNGIGIPQEELPFLFDRGFIGSNLRGGDYHSTGMGLYFVEKISKRLQIGIEVSSKEGEYTRFTFCFQNNASYLNLF